MKPSVKELTLISAKPEESQVAVGSHSSKGQKDSKRNSTTYENKPKLPKNSRQREENVGETLPTDVSDSSDSEENNVPFLATAECNSPHEGRQLVHTILPINIEILFNLLFSKSKFLLDFHAMRNSTDLVFGEWCTNEEEQKTRTVNITVQLAASIGPKTSRVTEYQVMRDCSKQGELYSIDINSVNAGIPYADSFSVLMHHCLVKTVDDNTMFSVHAQIKYKKSIWGVVKGIIEKNTWFGLEDFYTSLLNSLQSETCIPPARSKGRRPRKGTATQIRPLDELPSLPIKLENTELIVNGSKALSYQYSHHPVNTSPVALPQTTQKYKWLSLFVLLLLCFLLVIDVVLLLKLWKLEEHIENDIATRLKIQNIVAVKTFPNNHDDWIELLKQQEVLHETELTRIHNVVHTATHLLKRVEILFQNDKLAQSSDGFKNEL